MEAVASTMVRLQELAKSTGNRVRAAFQKRDEEEHDFKSDPIDILKRLQRQAFADIMRLRERQDKVEKLLLNSRTEKGSLFQEASTRVKGVVDVNAALSFAGVSSQQVLDILKKAGIRNGIASRFIFDTVIRKKDSFTVGLVAGNKSLAKHGDLPQSSLTLEKVLYSANVNDWLSVIASPLGAQCRDFGLCLTSLQGFSGFSMSEAPLLNEYHDYAAGFSFKNSYFNAALAGLVSEVNTHEDPARSCPTTFGQVSCQPFEGTKMSLSGLWRVPQSPFRRTRVGGFALPLVGLRPINSDARVSSSTLGGTSKPIDTVSTGSAAVMIEAEFDECTRLGGWVQVQKTHPNSQWAISLSDTPEDELGWGVRVGGCGEWHTSQVHIEGFLKLNLGRKFSLQPGFVYATDGKSHKPIFVLGSTWSL